MSSSSNVQPSEPSFGLSRTFTGSPRPRGSASLTEIGPGRWMAVPGRLGANPRTDRSASGLEYFGCWKPLLQQLSETWQAATHGSCVVGLTLTHTFATTLAAHNKFRWKCQIVQILMPSPLPSRPTQLSRGDCHLPLGARSKRRQVLGRIPLLGSSGNPRQTKTSSAAFPRPPG